MAIESEVCFWPNEIGISNVIERRKDVETRVTVLRTVLRTLGIEDSEMGKDHLALSHDRPEEATFVKCQLSSDGEYLRLEIGLMNVEFAIADVENALTLSRMR